MCLAGFFHFIIDLKRPDIYETIYNAVLCGPDTLLPQGTSESEWHYYMHEQMRSLSAKLEGHTCVACEYFYLWTMLSTSSLSVREGELVQLQLKVMA